MALFAEQHDFAISLLLLDDLARFVAFGEEAEADTYDKMLRAKLRRW